MTIIEALLGEHGVFYCQFDHLETAILSVETVSHVQGQVAVLAVALDSHADLEEALLFSELEPYLGAQAGPLAVMRMEHDEIRGALSRVPEATDLPEVRNLTLHAIRVAREHFAKEEQILFRMAKQVLDEETLVRLQIAWAERRKVHVY